MNNRVRFRPPNSRIEHVLKNRTQTDDIRSVLGIGQHLLGQGTTIDYRVGWAYAAEDQPDRLDTIFRQSKISFNPNVSPTSIDPLNIQANPSKNDPASATLNAWQTEVFHATDRDITAAFNLRTSPSNGGSRSAFLKVGAKVKDKKKMVDYEGDAENYDARERVLAGYAQLEFYLGDKLLFLPGFRYESTDIDYTGYEVIYDDGGDYASTRPATGTSRYGSFLPGAHLKYALTPNTNFRAAYSRTLARPNYYDLVPYQLVFQEDTEIARGNPDLEATTSDNIDVLVEHFLPSVGLLSGGFFYKHLNDYVYQYRFQEAAFGDSYLVTQPRNGDSATLRGLEVAFQNQLRWLPSPFDGIGVMANYTWTDSRATFPDRTVDAMLPGQSTHVGNVAIWFEKWGFSSRVAWNFHGKYIDAVGGDAATDVYYDNHSQVDLTVSQRLSRNLRLNVDVLNLTNAPLRYYEGTTDRPIQEEYYRWWMRFGLRVSF